MVKLIDNNKAVEISINEWDDESKQYGYDWAADFFEAGSLRQVPNLSDYTDADLAELGLPPRAVIQLDDVVEPSGRIIDGIGTFGCDDDGYLVNDVDYCIEQANDMVAGIGDLAPIPSRINPTTILIYSTSYEPLRFRDIENRTSKSSDMNYSSPTIGVRFRPGGGIQLQRAKENQ